jgi:hypothetical protein
MNDHAEKEIDWWYDWQNNCYSADFIRRIVRSILSERGYNEMVAKVTKEDWNNAIQKELDAVQQLKETILKQIEDSKISLRHIRIVIQALEKELIE